MQIRLEHHYYRYYASITLTTASRHDVSRNNLNLLTEPKTGKINFLLRESVNIRKQKV